MNTVNTGSRASTLKRKGTPEVLSPVKVCMHILRDARNDVRATRTSTALIEAGFAVSIIDVESGNSRPAEEVICGVHVHHLVMHRSFLSTRFENWFLVKVAVLFIRGLYVLVQTPADIYHACEITALPACYIAARLYGKPLIFEAYELPLLDRPLSEMHRIRRLFMKLFSILLALIIPRCAGVITVSPPIVQEICTSYHVSKIALICNLPLRRTVAAGDRLRQLLGISAHVRIALYQGNLQPDRSLDILVRSAAFLQPDIIIVMMGKGIGTTQSHLEALISSEESLISLKSFLRFPITNYLTGRHQRMWGYWCVHRPMHLIFACFYLTNSSNISWQGCRYSLPN